ncbi:ferritin-like domain-containing protein [Ferrimicrobium sp.]|uniref:ferritin-like domain-containing protein n=1 Tax=Ferrimicrobium sp. TaxID=2926050 RepID=UPI00260A778A|nr:ferritin-like domain-containing protein [Ferrimicrobium sp.]
MEISEAELNAKIVELDEIHHDVSLPALQEGAKDWAEEVAQERSQVEARSRLNRRTFLLGVGATVGAGALLAACGSSSSATKVSSSSSAPELSASTLTDLHVAALAASLENLGVYAYTAGINAAKAGKLGAVPPAVVVFAETARAQHKEHGAAWNAILRSAGKSAVTATDPVLTPVVNKDFASVTNTVDLAKLALEIENIAGETYLSAIGVLAQPIAIRTAASIEPVEMQHSAILNFILGTYPVPNAFEPTTLARPTSDYTKL